MTGNLEWTSVTNIKEQSCSIAKCDCVKTWELGQQYAIQLLSDKKDNNNYKLEPGYEARAKRCAAIYAQIYLESLGGKPNLKGRYYWMGLGAFASKTVAAVFNDMVTQAGHSADQIVKLISMGKYDLEGFGISGVHTFAKGNLWLFMDIAVWHFVWNMSPKDFEYCHAQRDTRKYIHIQQPFNNLPWVKSVGKLNYLQTTTQIQGAFLVNLKNIEKIFQSNNDTRQEKFNKSSKELYSHLMNIAVQEQYNILQKIVWNESNVQKGAQQQRKFGLPKAQLILSSDYSIGQDKVIPVRNHTIVSKSSFTRKTEHLSESPVSLPPQGTVVENYQSRMHWISLAAEKYHRLMQSVTGREFLEKELGIIAKWAGSKWSESMFDKLFFKISKESNDGKGGG